MANLMRCRLATFRAKMMRVLHVLCMLLSWEAAIGAASADEPRSRILFLVSRDPDNYEADRTIPSFASELEREGKWQSTVLLGAGPREAFEFPDLERALAETDLLAVFCRRVALRPAPMSALQRYASSGRPIVGIRTANHAFSVRPPGPKQGYVDWQRFVPEVLGHENKGYGSIAAGTSVEFAPGAREHPILRGVEPDRWKAKGTLYKVLPLLDENAEWLLIGRADGETHPVAWTRITAAGGRVFYTSLGDPTDFEMPQFRTLLKNGIAWAARK